MAISDSAATAALAASAGPLDRRLNRGSLFNNALIACLFYSMRPDWKMNVKEARPLRLCLFAASICYPRLLRTGRALRRHIIGELAIGLLAGPGDAAHQHLLDRGVLQAVHHMALHPDKGAGRLTARQGV